MGGIVKSVGDTLSTAGQDFIGQNGWNGFRDLQESFAPAVGNYLLPGSALVTSGLVSKGAQSLDQTPIGQVGTAAAGLAGAGVGSDTTGIAPASSVGAGWTNAANGLGGLVGDGTLGTDIGNGVSSFTNGLSNALKSGVGSVTDALGIGGNGAATGAESISPSLAAADPSLTNAVSSNPGFISPTNANSTALSVGSGGGASSYGLGPSLLGTANSLYANSQAQKDLVDSQNKAISTLNPYLASGTAANSKLSDLLGTSGNTGTPGYGSLTTPYTPADLANDPGYQFQLQQGNLALNRKAAATGSLDSGAALKAAQDYGQGLAGTAYTNAFNRNLQQNQATYGDLAGQAGSGATAANNAGNIYTNIGNAQANSGISSANNINQTLSSLLSGNGAKQPYVMANGQIGYR